MTLAALLDRSGTSIGEVTGHLAARSHAEGVDECLALTPPRQRRLWELASAADLPPGELVADTTSAFAGRNSLRIFSRFEKWFARQGGSTFGFNRHVLRPLIGPGYFTVRNERPGELVFDYRELPAQAPRTWPAVRSNSDFFARPVYGDLLDRVAWVSSDVLIGAAFRRDTPLNSYFVLVRT